MKPLSIETQKQDCLCPFKLIKKMKEKSNENSPASENSRSWKTFGGESDIDYLFVKPRETESNQTENSISKFLSEEGVFQINLGIVMNDYKFKTL